MPHRETRKVWLLLKDGVPSHTSWGHVKTELDAQIGGLPPEDRNAAACMRGLDPADGWDAVPTAWRRPPSFLYGGGARGLKINLPRLEGRDLVIAGCRCSLDLPGRPKLMGDGRSVVAEAVAAGIDVARIEAAFADPAREPHRPDLIVEDEDAMLSVVEELRDIAVARRSERVRALLKGGLTPAQITAKGLDLPIAAETTFTEKGTRKHWRVTSGPAASHRGNEVLIHRDKAGKKQRKERAPV